MLAICHEGGYEPRISRRTFHSVGDTNTLASAIAVALAPESASGRIPGGGSAGALPQNSYRSALRTN